MGDVEITQFVVGDKARPAAPRAHRVAAFGNHVTISAQSNGHDGEFSGFNAPGAATKPAIKNRPE
jgi:hypothetical protein